MGVRLLFRIINFLCSDDNLLLQTADADFERNNFDFLHGGIGIAWYVMYLFAGV